MCSILRILMKIFFFFKIRVYTKLNDRWKHPFIRKMTNNLSVVITSYCCYCFLSSVFFSKGSFLKFLVLTEMCDISDRWIKSTVVIFVLYSSGKSNTTSHKIHIQGCWVWWGEMNYFKSKDLILCIVQKIFKSVFF